MILIWRGWGILALLIPALVCLLPTALMASLAATVHNLAPIGATLAITGALAALWVWNLGNRWNTGPGREMIDAATGQRILLRPSHTFFFIPMQWWAPVIAVLTVLPGILLTIGGIVMLFVSPTTH